MARLGMLIDLQRCIGCSACNVACKQENNVPPLINRNQVFSVGPLGEYPDLKGYYLPRPCMQCEDAACVAACPTGAAHQRGDGLVVINTDKCIVCGYCVWACPYGARDVNQTAQKIEACDMCAHLVDKGEEPACVRACMARARFFGDLTIRIRPFLSIWPPTRIASSACWRAREPSPASSIWLPRSVC